MLANVSGIESERTVSKLRIRKRKYLCCAHKAGARNSEVSCRSRATMAKKCTKNHDAREKLLFC